PGGGVAVVPHAVTTELSTRANHALKPTGQSITRDEIALVRGNPTSTVRPVRSSRGSGRHRCLLTVPKRTHRESDRLPPRYLPRGSLSTSRRLRTPPRRSESRQCSLGRLPRPPLQLRQRKTSHLSTRSRCG